LKTFVAETLEQILIGIRDAQKKDGGSGINAEMYTGTTGHIITAGSDGTFVRVDFDVAVSAETAGHGKAGLTVFGVGAAAGGEHKTGFANRITFSVPLGLPDGKRADASQGSQVRSEYHPYHSVEDD